MTTAVLPHNPSLPRAGDGMGPGLALSVAVHIGLVIALAFGVSWRASEPEGVTAELWAAVPQIAAPRAAEPTPQPTPAPPQKPVAKPEPTPPKAVPDAQIAIEKAKKEKAKKKEDEKEKKVLADKAKAERLKKEEARKDEQLALQREANIKRILGEASATATVNTAGKASHTAGPSAAYGGRIKARIKPNITFADTTGGNPTAEVEVRCAPDGTIIASKLTKSSGVKAWDDAVLRALEKTEILPRDTDGTVPSPMVITFRPRDF